MRRLAHLATLMLLIVAGVGSFAGPAAAHNSLVSSDPADGATVDVAPASVTMNFAKSVPLDTMSLEMIDATGIRQDLTTLTHGPAGDSQVLASIPAVTPGEVTLRWALVGADGHRLTGRFAFTVAAAAPVVQETLAPTVDPALVPTVVASIDPAPTSAPTIVPLVVSDTAVPPQVVADEQSSGFSEPFVTNDVVRWVLRVLSYAAMLAIVGVLAMAAFVWPRAWSKGSLPRVVSYSHLAVGGLAAVQLLVVASDVSGDAPWAAISGLDGAFETDAGRAFVLRIVLIAALWFVVFRARFADQRQRWIIAGAVATLTLATWSFAGHSKSMRWALIGVPFDVAHFAAAGAWIGGLAIIGLVAIRHADTEELVGVVGRFGQLARVSVAVLVGTGVVQTLRLGGSPLRLFEVNHGRWLVVKVLMLGVMLFVADVNRKRVTRRFASPDRLTNRATEMLRRAMITELAVGATIMAITAIIVVSPPATADNGVSAVTDTPSTVTAPVVSNTLAPLAAPVATPAPATAAPTPCVIAASLQLGASGPEVTCLQQALMAAGVFTGPASGTFDDATEAAVRAFQTANALLADGIVGPVTGAKLGIWPGE